ncbi:hypothetical protein [Kaarinaea lacus]
MKQTFPTIIRKIHFHIFNGALSSHMFNRTLKYFSGLLLLLSLTGCATAPINHQEDTWFGQDKYAHFLLSGLTSAVIAKAAKEDGRDNCDAAVIGIGITLSLGAAKESYDKRYKKTLYSSHDMVWNLAGSTIGSLAGSNCH